MIIVNSILKSDLEKIIGSEEIGWYDYNGVFHHLNPSKLIDFALAHPDFVLEDYKRHLEKNYLEDATAFEEIYPKSEGRVDALQNYFKFCEGLLKLVSGD